MQSGPIYAEFHLKKQRENPDLLKQPDPHVLRLFDFGVFEGSETETKFSKNVPGKLLWVAKGLLNSKHTGFLFESNEELMNPFNRIKLKNDFKNVVNEKNLNIEYFMIDFENEETVDFPFMENCAFQSQGKCLKCDELYELNWEQNVCQKCAKIYINFLGKCFSENGNSVSQYLSGLTSKEYTFEKTTINTDTIKLNSFTTLDENISSNVSSFLDIPLLSFNELSENEMILIFSKEVNYAFDSVPPVVYYFWGNKFSDFNNNEIKFNFKNKILGVSSSHKSFTISTSMLNRKNTNKNFISSIHNFILTYEHKSIDSEEINLGLFSSPNQTQILEISQEKLSKLIQEETHNNISLFPVNFNPQIIKNSVLGFYGLYHYQLYNPSNNISPQFPESNKYINQLSSIYLYSECPSNCVSCSSNINCEKCESGYFLLSGLCSKCDDACLECHSHQSNCKVCTKNGIFLF
jgi:hypothetical protein